MPVSAQHIAIHPIHSEFVDIGVQWNMADVRSTFWRLYINNRDGASISWAGGVHRLSKGHVHLIPAYVRFTCHNTALVRHLYIHFDVVGLPPSLQQQVFDRPFTTVLTTTAKRLWATGGIAGGRQSAYRACVAQAAMYDALSLYMTHLPPERRTLLDESTGKSSVVGPAISLVDQRLPGVVSVHEMADACAISEDHFGRVFRKTIGQTPARYILERRIALAARELLYEDRRIEAVARRHGFANRFHFTRAFARVIGTTPAAYRDTNRV